MKTFLKACAALSLAAATPAFAQAAAKTTDFPAATDKTKGKSIAYLPVAMGITLTEIWWSQIQKGAESAGMKALIRDPNWSSSAETQALTSLIAEKPTVIVVHNPNVQLLAKQLEKAQKEGIYVVQVNMVSKYKTDAYVGADWDALGKQTAEAMVKDCGTGSGKSGKVAIIQGELTSETSLGQMRAALPILKADKGIKVVSSQAANWDATQAHNVASTVLQQNPDLCGIYGFWDTMTLGASQAVKEAGLAGKVNVYTSGDGSKLACDSIANGAFTQYYNYDAEAQGRAIIQKAAELINSGKKPGSTHEMLFSPISVITKANVASVKCPNFVMKK